MIAKQNYSSTKPRFLLWGGKSQARILDAMINELNLGKVEVIFDFTVDKLDFNTNAAFTNNPIELREHLPNVSHYIVCIGSEHGFARYKTAQFLDDVKLRNFNIIHPSAYFDNTSSIGRGCQIMPRAVIHKFCTIGSQAIINTNATIDHECAIGNGVHIMGNAALAGKVVVEDFASIGTNSTVLPNIKIGEGAIVGAGAVVTKDVDPCAIVVGTPAKVVGTHKYKINQISFELL